MRAVQEVADLFLPVYEESEGHDGHVSLEVSPHLAYDPAGTLTEAVPACSETGQVSVDGVFVSSDHRLKTLSKSIDCGPLPGQMAMAHRLLDRRHEAIH